MSASEYERELDVWDRYLAECEHIKARLRALGFEGEDVWTLAEQAASRFEQLNELHAAGRITIT